MPRVRFRDLGGTLFVTGAREDTPDGTVRRGRGLHAVRARSARSRAGSTKLFDLAAHSLTRFSSTRYAGVGTGFTRNGASIIAFPLSGNRLALVPMQPTAGKPDQLFVAGGGTLFKTDPTGATSLWGIDKPAFGPLAVPIAQQSKPIDTFDNEAASFSLTPGSDADATPGAGKANEAALTIDGGSFEIDLGRMKHRAYQRVFAGPMNLRVFPSGDVSPDEDYIELWVHLGNPHRIEQVSLDFFVGEQPDGDGKVNNLYTKDILVEDQVTKKQLQRERGLGDLLQVTDQELAFKALEHTMPSMLSTQETLGTTKLVATRHTWTRLRLPKSTFHRAGNNGGGWEDIRGIRVGVRTNAMGPADSVTKVYFDACSMIGSVGMQGDYQWLVTYLNANTGTRSNPNDTPTELKGLVRQGAELAFLPTSSDPQVTHVEIWRTLGNGAVFFKAGQKPNGPPLLFVDKVADYIGLFSSPGPVLGDDVLPFDNVNPRDFAVQDAVGPHYGRMFWARDGSGKIYFSPPDRAEAVAGFILITDTDDEVQKLVRWNDILYAVTTEGFYQVIGVGEPFVVQKLLDVPGTVRPFTVVATPGGVFYQASDGIRVFDGSGSRLVAPEALGVLYRGQAAENLPAFTGVVATYGNDQYVVSDGVVTLAYHLTDGRWRDLGVGSSALFFEDETGLLTASVGSKILVLEDPATASDDGEPISFVLQPPSVAPAAGQETLLQRLYVEARTNGQLLRPTLLLDDQEVGLPPLVTTAQAVVEYSLLRKGRVVGVRLDGNLVQPVEVVGLELDHYVAGAVSAA